MSKGNQVTEERFKKNVLKTAYCQSKVSRLYFKQAFVLYITAFLYINGISFFPDQKKQKERNITRFQLKSTFLGMGSERQSILSTTTKFLHPCFTGLSTDVHCIIETRPNTSTESP
jgi:hypothetical protein